MDAFGRCESFARGDPVRPPTVDFAAPLRAQVPSPDQVAPEARRAALLLHGIARGDRSWLLGMLDERERAALEPLLEELQELGVPADRQLLGELTGAPAEPRDASVGSNDRGGPAEGAGPGLDHERLDRADPARLAAVLRDEPPGVIARLIAIRSWAWREELLPRLGEKRRHVLDQLGQVPRRQPETAGKDGAFGALLDQHLVAAVLRRLDSDEASQRPAANVGAQGRPAKRAAGLAGLVGRWLPWGQGASR